MTRAEFMTAFVRELRELGVPDINDITAEYESHFDFRLADGYTEEEIAARLGDPHGLAMQFEAPPSRRTPKRLLTLFAATLVDLLASLVGLMLVAWLIVLCALSAAAATVGFCLALNVNVLSLLPDMPYANALLFGLSFISLGLFVACCTLYCGAYIRQWLRVYLRARARMLSGSALPEKSIHPAIRRPLAMTLSLTSMISLAAFGVLFIVSFVILAIRCGDIQFWHALGWFS